VLLRTRAAAVAPAGPLVGGKDSCDRAKTPPKQVLTLYSIKQKDQGQTFHVAADEERTSLPHNKTLSTGHK